MLASIGVLLCFASGIYASSSCPGASSLSVVGFKVWDGTPTCFYGVYYAFHYFPFRIIKLGHLPSKTLHMNHAACVWNAMNLELLQSNSFLAVNLQWHPPTLMFAPH